MGIPSISLSKEELEQNCRIMRKGNTILRKFSEITGLSLKAFRIRLFKVGPDVKENWPELTLAQLEELQFGWKAIQHIKAIEWDMIQCFSRLVHQLASRFCKGYQLRTSGSIISIADCVQEATLALIDAIFTYDNEKIKFITYAFTCIRNKLTQMVAKNAPLSPLTGEVPDLMRRYEIQKASYNRHVTDDEVFADLKLDEREIKILTKAKAKVWTSREWRDTDESRSFSNDYTEARHGIEHEKPFPADFEIEEVIGRAGLDEIEKKIIATAIRPYAGWQTDLAANNINPNTGKPYTRQRMGQIVHAAYDKVRKALALTESR